MDKNLKLSLEELKTFLASVDETVQINDEHVAKAKVAIDRITRHLESEKLKAADRASKKKK